MRTKSTILLAFAVAATLLIGCGAKKDTAKNPWDEKPELQKETVSYKKELIISDGEVGAWYIYEYDDQGRMTKYIKTGTTSEGSAVVIYEYSYHEVK